MKTSSILRCAAAALAAGASFTASTSASAKSLPESSKSIGAWEYESGEKYCTIGTKGLSGMLLMMSTNTGTSGMIVVPSDQSLITPDNQYPLKISLEGSPEADMTGSAGTFGGSKVLYIKINAAGIAGDASDGFSMRVKLNGAVVFDKDMHGSKDAFAAFVACSKTLTL
jgi:hypothetical protein